MFSGFSDETVRFLMDLKFHNNTEFFHQHHDRYVAFVQEPFYALIGELAPEMRKIDPAMEIRPYKCLSRIHRDTRFSKDKSPYRDHHWFLFRREAEPRERSLNFYFEFGPDRLSWGLGVWGENRELFDLFRKRMRADPKGVMSLLEEIDPAGKHLIPGLSCYRRMEVPPEIPEQLKPWYCIREMYISRNDADYQDAFSERLAPEVQKDFRSLSPLYRLLRGCADELTEGNPERNMK